MKEGVITRVKINPSDPVKADWRALDAMSEVDVLAAALSDPDALPATDEALARARRPVDVKALRQRLTLT